MPFQVLWCMRLPPLKCRRKKPDGMYVNQATGNGGFPLPAPGGRERVVETTHAACSGRTRVSLPAALSSRVVRRVVCDNCEELYETEEVVEVREGRKRFDFRWLTLPVAALAVLAVLSLVNGGGSGSAPSTTEPTATASPAEVPVKTKAETGPAKKADGANPAPVQDDAQLVSESTFSLALPPGWDRVNPAAGATFAAMSADGTADATLWIQNDPKLDLGTFEANSLQQLEALAGDAEVVERKVGPTVESTSLVLAPKGVPEGSPTYEVVLRGAGDNWYYLATTYQAGAPADAASGVELIQGSFLPHGVKG